MSQTTEAQKFNVVTRCARRLVLLTAVAVLAGLGSAGVASAATVTTGSASSIYDTGATLNGTLNGYGAYYYFEYGTDTNYGHTSSNNGSPVGSGDNPVKGDAIGLTAGTLYHFRLVAHDYNNDPHYGNDSTFTTTGQAPPQAGPPTAVTGSLSTAQVNGQPGSYFTGTVNPNNAATTYSFDYGTDTSYGQSVSGQINGGPYNDPVDAFGPALTPGTTYHYRLVATNVKGTSEGADTTFTAPGGVTEATLGAASAVTHDGFTLNATINPHGNAQEVQFAYIAYSANNPHTEYSTGYSVSQTIPGDGSDHVVSIPVPLGFDDLFAARWPSNPFSHTTTSRRPDPAVTVHYRLRYTDGTGHGALTSEKTVTSPVPSQPPTPTTGGAYVASDGDHPFLHLVGTVDNHGQGYSWTAFQVGPTTAYGAYCPTGDDYRSGDDPLFYSPPTPSSQPRTTSHTAYCYGGQTLPPVGTTVHYRYVADNGGPGAQPVYSADQTFTVPPSATQVVAALAKALVPSGAAAKVAAILKAGAYPAALNSPSAGTAGISWYQVPAGAHITSAKKPVLVASGTKTLTKAGRVKIKVKLTSKGKSLLKKVKKGHKLKLTGKGSFTPKGGKKTSKLKGFTLKR
jgi:hypothetical protein